MFRFHALKGAINKRLGKKLRCYSEKILVEESPLLEVSLFTIVCNVVWLSTCEKQYGDFSRK